FDILERGHEERHVPHWVHDEKQQYRSGGDRHVGFLTRRAGSASDRKSRRIRSLALPAHSERRLRQSELPLMQRRRDQYRIDTSLRGRRQPLRPAPPTAGNEFEIRESLFGSGAKRFRAGTAGKTNSANIQDDRTPHAPTSRPTHHEVDQLP